MLDAEYLGTRVRFDAHPLPVEKQLVRTAILSATFLPDLDLKFVGELSVAGELASFASVGGGGGTWVIRID